MAVLLPDLKSEQTCDALSIELTDSVVHRFFTNKEVRSLLTRENVMPVGRPYDSISTQHIEDATMLLPVVKQAQCYKSNEGVVHLLITQRKPVLRVMSDENYYVCSDREVLYATFRTACYVPVVTGRVTKQMAQTELYDFVVWLSNNNYWNEQIQQINVTAQRQIELIPRQGTHTIRLGTIDGYEHKLKKLQTFYEQAFHQMGWVAYRELDISYNGQGIGRK